MGADGVGYVPDVDGVEVLAVGRPLHKELVVEVVAVVDHKHVNVPHYLQHIKPLWGEDPYIAGTTK